MLVNLKMHQSSSHDEAVASFCVSTAPDLTIGIGLRKGIVAGKPAIFFEVGAQPGNLAVCHQVQYAGEVKDCRHGLMRVLQKVTPDLARNVLFPLCQKLTALTGVPIALKDLYPAEYPEMLVAAGNAPADGALAVSAAANKVEGA